MSTVSDLVDELKGPVGMFVREHAPEGTRWSVRMVADDLYAKATIKGIITTQGTIKRFLVCLRRERRGGDTSRTYETKLRALTGVIANLHLENNALKKEVARLNKDVEYKDGLLQSILLGILDAGIQLKPE